jgi:acyl transferase domain-containing protein/NAD(P)-dependent dehydrogenase (short-subunit alcohol dehydrogenase family)/acyl carrier protein
MTDRIRELIDKVRNNELSVEFAKQELVKLKSMGMADAYFYKRELIHTPNKARDINAECFIIITENDDLSRDIIKGIKEKTGLKKGINVIKVSEGEDFTVSQDNLTMDLQCELHYEKLTDFLKENHKNQLLHFIYILPDDLGKKAERPELVLFFLAKSVAYKFKNNGIFVQMFSTGRNIDDVIVHKALSALGESIHREDGSFVCQVAYTGRDISVNSGTEIIINEIFSEIENNLVIYDNGIRKTERVVRSSINRKSHTHISSGNYILIGGLGGIGRKLASKILSDKNSTVVIAGRTELNNAVMQKLRAVSNDDSRIKYISCDVSNKDSVNKLLKETIAIFGKIDYIIHCAGILEDKSIVNKSLDSFDRVIKSKVDGAKCIIEEADGYNYKEILFFTSTSGFFGNEGQADYAFSNCFIDYLCEEMYSQGKNVFSIALPLWDLDGMEMSEIKKRKIYDGFGMIPMPMDIGIDIINQALDDRFSGKAVIYGNEDKIKSFVSKSGSISLNKPKKNTDVITNRTNDTAGLIAYEFIRKVIEDVTGVSKEEIKDSTRIDSLGMDSVMIAEVNLYIENMIGAQEKTLFFEYKTIGRIVDYLIQNYGDKFQNGLTEADDYVAATQEVQSTKKIREYLSDVIGTICGYEKGTLGYNTKFRDLGIDSVMISEINRELEQIFGELSNTLVFSYSSINELSEYLCNQYPEAINKHFNQSLPENTDSDILIQEDEDKIIICDVAAAVNTDIAIIGIAGQYPQAENLDLFWDNLKEGKDCIETIPDDRWDYREFQQIKDDDDWWKTGAIWGGFIKDIDKFDALSFNIAPNDAIMMDPHQRIYAQIVWHALEDAGYSKKRLGSLAAGVYTGAMWNNYQLFGIDDAYQGEMKAYDSSMCSISNRISYIFDLHGPSITLDTMCSSSLVAIHLACQAIKNNDIDIAVAGGVNLTLHPYKYIQLIKGHFLSKDGKCRAFGEGGSGYVPGEGCGAVILKKLENAVRDNDKIYGVIKSSSVNHCGKSIGYSVPDPVQQGKVINKALESSGINPETISYIEAHGTGTPVGDPIEIAGLKNVFGYYGNRKFCSIGSVKSNIGHLEAAAGIASLTKVLLQIKHRQLVPSIHTEVLNPNIKLDDTPFTIQREFSKWNSEDVVLRAGISAFGAGGTNAHIIVEEFQNDESQVINVIKKDNVVLLSANNKDILNKHILNFIGYLKDNENSSELLTRIAYTSQIARNHMKERLAIVTDNINELIYDLGNFIDGKSSGRVFLGHVASAQMDKQTIEVDYQEGYSIEELSELAKAWTEGNVITWEKMYDGRDIRIADIPKYPFAKERYWLPTGKSLIFEKFENTADVASQTEFYIPQLAENDGQIINRNNNYHVLIITGLNNTGFISTAHGKYKSVTVASSVNSKGIAPDSIAVSAYNADGYSSLINYYSDKGIIPGLILDFSHIEEETKSNYKIPHGKLNFLKWLLHSERKAGIEYICCTKGLKEGDNLNGAVFSDFINILSGEYSNFTGKCIDFNQGTKFKEIFEISEDEADKAYEGKIFWNNGKRFVEKLIAKSKVIPKEVDTYAGTYVITGGTRGIGAEIALHLSRNGVKNLALIGRSSMDTQEKRALLRQLSDNGANVRVYVEGFDDSKRVKEFLKEISNEYGHIDCLIHCAGCYSSDNAAFIFKTENEIDRVMEPKVKGSLAIIEAASEIEIGNIVLFSSISSIAPWLAKGLSDYSAANSFLSRIVPYYCKRNSGKITSIIWPNWEDTGFKAKESQQYASSGIMSLGINEGINILMQIINGQNDNIILPVKHTAGFNADSLMQISLKNTEPVGQNKSDKNLICKDRNEVIESIVRSTLALVLGIEKDKLEGDETFENYGMDSIYLTDIIKRLEKKFNVKLDPTLFFECNTIDMLVGRISPMVVDSNPAVEERHELVNRDGDNGRHEFLAQNYTDNKIAVIGMSCKFADADSLDEYWNNVVNGFCSIIEIPKDRFDMDKYYSQKRENGKTVGKWAGLVKNIEWFDPEYFGVRKDEAKFVDPLIRMALENSIGAIYDAGYGKADIKGKNIGIFMGSRMGEFSHIFPQGEYGKISNVGQNFIAAYISQFLDIKGPAMVIDTACSSALVSLNEACNNILLGECDMALVGGVDAIINEKTFLMLSEALSPTGKCCAFDESANGFVPGEGCGVVLIKKLEKAVEDGDNILAVIDAVAVNNDGKTMGITTPNMNAQMDVIQKAIDKSKVNPEQITYIEAHGTGTLIGDPIELKALTKVYRKYTSNTQYCRIGSVKSNIGHTLSAAGIASLIKVILCMQHRSIPPTLNCNNPNPRFNFKESPFYPITEREEWTGIEGKLLAGISSFGFGGTNAHVIVSNYRGNHSVIRRKTDHIEYHKERYWPQEDNKLPENKNIMLPGFGFRKIT